MTKRIVVIGSMASGETLTLEIDPAELIRETMGWPKL